MQVVLTLGSSLVTNNPFQCEKKALLKAQRTRRLGTFYYTRMSRTDIDKVWHWSDSGLIYIYVCVIWEGDVLTLIVIFSIVSSLRKGDSWMDKSDKGVKWKNGMLRNISGTERFVI